MATKTVTDRELDALYDSVMKCEPVIPPNEVDQVANLVFSKERVIRAWRAAALLGSKGGDFYREVAEKEDLARALAEGIAPIQCTAEVLREMAGIMDCVAARLLTAGCNHEHFNDWME